ncbi:MAG: prephenate dehydratase [Burkholderiales bacterium]|nr:prephenate dehydratase [Burkholderiales bacterium]
MSDLPRLRQEIDRLDDELLALLNARARVSQQIGQVKRSEDPAAPVFRAEREAALLRRLEGANPGPLPADAVSRIFHEVMSASSALQRPIRAAYLGPAGTFSEQAMLRQFGHSAAGIACASFDEAFRRAESGAADFAVVPVENSTEGTVSRVLDLLLGSPLKVCAEVVLRVEQNLMRARAGMDGISKVYSHGQSLAQTREWLNRNLPGVDRVTVESNAEAARLASLDPATAAVAGANAAANFGLNILAANIEDDATNRTRFVVVGRNDSEPSGRDRTWLVMSAPNVAGGLVKLLSPFARHGVSMTKIESRPARLASMPGSWEYMFYVDLEGHQRDAGLAASLAELRGIAPYLKIFGSYPVGDY